MHKQFSILMLICYVLVLLGPAIPLIDYGIRYDYYANVLCENKDRPELKCNGTCKLAQLMKASEEAQHAEGHGPEGLEAPCMVLLFLPENNTQVQAPEPLAKCVFHLPRQADVRDQWRGSIPVPPPWA
ncbi:MAG: hypothetical protein AB8F95_05500 [Bacteroidia bacterium]